MQGKETRAIDMDHASSLEKAEIHAIDDVARHGQAGTDRYGRPLVAVDKKAEAALCRKIDVRIIPVVALLYLFCFMRKDCFNASNLRSNMTFTVDRANIGNARVAGLERDLNILPPTYGGYGYNLLLTAFYIAYVVFEIPMQMLNKIIGPGKFIPILSFAFGLFSFVMAFVHNFGAAFAVRFLLGVAEGGVFPGIAFYLSRWYRKDELGFRMALYIVCAPLAGAFGGLLASGFLATDGFGMVRTWRIIFFAEGLITMGIAIISYFLLPESPEHASWLTPEEKALAAARIKSENVGSTEVIDQMHGSVVWHAMFNPTTLVNCFIFLLDNIVVQGLGFFLPTILRSIYPGLSTIQIQLRSVPPYVVGAFFTLLLPFLSWKTRQRALYMCIAAPFVMLGYAMFLGTQDPQARYAAVFMIAIGAFVFGPFCNTWAAINTTSDTARAATLSATVFSGNLGGLAATWTYVPKQAPRQIPGNATNMAGSTMMLLCTIGLWVWQRRENKKKEEGRHDHVLEGKSEAEISMLEQRHPGFRYRH